MTTTSGSPSPQAAPRSGHLSFIIILGLLLIIGGLLCWHFNVFARRPSIALVAGEGPYFNLIVEGAQEAARQYDVELNVVRVGRDAQSDAIRKLIDDGCDGIAISPTHPVSDALLLSEVAGKTTLVTYDSDSPVSNRLCFVGTDNYAAGRLAGTQVRQAIGDGGEVLISSGSLDKDNVQRRRQGVIDELLDRSFEPARESDPVEGVLKGPNFTVVATLIDAGSGEDVVTQIGKALSDHPNIKCAVGINTASAPRLVKAIEQAGKTGKIQVVGFDADPATLDAIDSGAVRVAVLQDQFGCGFHAVRILAENARGDRSGLPMFQRRTLPVELVTKANLAATRAQLSAGHPTTQAGT